MSLEDSFLFHFFEWKTYSSLFPPHMGLSSGTVISERTQCSGENVPSWRHRPPVFFSPVSISVLQSLCPTFPVFPSRCPSVLFSLCPPVSLSSCAAALPLLSLSVLGKTNMSQINSDVWVCALIFSEKWKENTETFPSPTFCPLSAGVKQIQTQKKNSKAKHGGLKCLKWQKFCVILKPFQLNGTLCAHCTRVRPYQTEVSSPFLTDLVARQLKSSPNTNPVLRTMPAAELSDSVCTWAHERSWVVVFLFYTTSCQRLSKRVLSTNRKWGGLTRSLAEQNGLHCCLCAGRIWVFKQSSLLEGDEDGSLGLAKGESVSWKTALGLPGLLELREPQHLEQRTVL